MDIQIIYSYLKYHKINHPYEFMNKFGKIKFGIVKEINVRMDEFQTSIIYLVETDDGKFLNIDHETNREI